MIIALDGPDGAGKSTQVRDLVAWARAEGHSAAVVGKWDVFRHDVVPYARFLRGTDQVDLRTCIAEMPTPARMLFLGWMNATAATRALERTEDLVVLDGYRAKHAAAELLADCPPDLVHTINATMAPVDSVVYLDVTPEEALRRKGDDLAPYECGRDAGCSPARFLTHQTAVRRVLLDWARTRGWTVIPSDSQQNVQRALRDHVTALLHTRTAVGQR
ncbi:hypothetical protein [Nocardia sp. NRRL S-836]|uniref:Thymidylate kinase-like protein n=1 Tax=Lentzea sp. NRRL S-836 TaxID=1415540 RepID=U5YNY4_9PSEU|nr:hypothetical protein [Nocardia sp. NRRL S-836]AGZ94449.1 thymidylate kinase-like protein [Lentzea sp. NRRL S-836]